MVGGEGGCWWVLLVTLYQAVFSETRDYPWCIIRRTRSVCILGILHEECATVTLVTRCCGRLTCFLLIEKVLVMKHFIPEARNTKLSLT